MSCATAARPRLLVLASTYPRWKGDPEPGFVHELSRRLVDRFDVTVLCPHAAGASPDEVLDGVRVLRYRYAPDRYERLVNEGGIVANLRRAPWMWALLPSFFIVQALAAWKLAHRERCDVVHAHWLIPQGLVLAGLAALGRNVAPFLVTSHGADLFALKAPVFRWFKRFVLRKAAAVTVVSTAMRNAIGELGVDARRVSIQPMGVDLQDRFRREDACARVPDSLLFVGRLVQKKGVRHLLDAMPAVLAARPAARLDVVGFGPEMDALVAQVGRLGLADRVRFVGALRQDELPGAYRRAHVFVAPFVESENGDQEGLGLVVIEALGCGCRAVISDLPATRELGDDIPLLQRVPPGDAGALADAILRALSVDPSTENATPSLMRFDWTARAAAYAEKIDEIAIKDRGFR